MSTKLNPYIMFPGTAREAMTFYESVFGGKLDVMTFGDAGAEGVPDPQQVMHAQLETATGFTLMASDTPPGGEYQPGGSMSVSLSGDESDELRRYWDALSGDGTVTVPFEKQMWGDEFGACIDRFGVSWMVNVAGASPG